MVLLEHQKQERQRKAERCEDMKDVITKEELNKLVEEGKLKLHHSALARGYHTNKCVTIEDYKGKFGTGYKLHSNYHRSNRYHLINYYIFNGGLSDGENNKRC